MNRGKPEALLKPKLLAVSVAACFALNAAPLRANPTGPTVVHGGVGFNGLGSSALTITNQAGGNAIINWNGFSIGINELTRFQQFANLAVLNRVTGSDISSILGSLQSDGRVFLINPNGVVFGASARIDVAGMVASSLSFSDQDFLANRLRFTEVPGAGAVVNNGVIQTAAGGRVYLVAPTVENNGLIQSPQGAIVLAAGKEVELVDAASPFVTVKVAAAEQAVNVGNLVADSGQIGMFGALVRNAGVVEAGGAVAGPGGEIRLVAAKDLTLEAGSVVSANGTSGGKVLLQAEGGTNLIGGTVEARGSSGRGGEVSALGVRVGVVGHGVIDASGDNGGGTVLVGGDYQGGNAAVQNAERTYIGADGVIRADAMTTGDGGRVIAWADGDTRFFGSISAKGGSEGGNGGFVETSGKGSLQAFGSVNVAAPSGQGGTWLLDPANINISPSVGLPDNGGIEFDGLLAFAEFPGATTNVGAGSIESALAYGSVYGGFSLVQLQATNDITFNGNITIATPGALTLQAGNDIRFNSFSLTTNGNLTLQAAASGGTPVTGAITSVPGGGNMTTTGGNFIASGYSVSLGNINTVGGAYGGGSVSLTAQSSNLTAGSVTTGGNWVSMSAWSGDIGVGSINTSNTLGDTGFGTSNGWVDIYSYGNITTGGITTSGLHPRHGAAGSVFMHSESGTIVVNGNISARGADGFDNGSDSDYYGGTRGGDIVLSRGGATFAGTAIQVNGSISAPGGNGVTASDLIGVNHGGGDGGSVTFGDYCDGFCGDLSGDVVVTGTINVSGGHGGSTDNASSSTQGGHAGPITMAIDGSFTGSSLIARGGNAGSGSDGNFGSNFGGWGGDVDIVAGAQVSIGSIDTSAGAGGNAGGTISSTNSFGGDGGSAGYVAVDAGSIAIGGISALGGNGGAGGSASGYSGSWGGDGGEGGPILLFASAGPTVISGAVNASGGNGGAAGSASDYAMGGQGGSAASIGCCKELALISEVALDQVFVQLPTRFVFNGIAIEGTSVTTGPIIGRGGAGGAGGTVSTGVGYASGGGGGGGATVWLGTTSDGSTYATGPVTAGLIDVSGGAGGNSGPLGTSWTWGGSGGWGGQVEIYGSTVNILGPILAPGGQGGNAINGSIPSTSFPSSTPDGGSGGSGGGASIYATGETSINAGATLGATAINVSGGAGGAGAPANSPAGDGGNGGGGGSLSIASTPNMTLFGSALAAGGAGGAGGAGNLSNTGGTGGNGGSGGQVFLDASSITENKLGDGFIFVLAGTQFNVQGGFGGSGGANGGAPGTSGTTSSTFIKGADYFGTILVLDPLSVPGINEGFQQIVEGGNETTAFVGGEKQDEEEDKSQKELGSCKG